MLLLASPWVCAAAADSPPDGVTLDPRLEWVSQLPPGPFVDLEDGGILAIDQTQKLVSRDGGLTWQRSLLFDPEASYVVRPEYVLLRTQEGSLILAFANDSERQWAWDKDLKEPGPDVRLPTYVSRSTDNGKSWQTPQMLHADWTGAIRDILQTRDGAIVFTSMKVLRNPGRHGCLTYRSTDDGLTWTPSNLLDLGGQGHHDGALEPTIVQRRDGRLWMLIRTTLDVFYESFSSDDGLTWSGPTPTPIGAGTAPGMIQRLGDGRLVLVWNRLQLEGRNDHPRRGGDGQWSAVPSVNQRQQLSIAFSNDEGQSWSPPTVVVDAPRIDTSYPQLYEHASGQLWLTTMRGTVRASFNPADFQTQEP